MISEQLKDNLVDEIVKALIGQGTQGMELPALDRRGHQGHGCD
jgi:hypothetical protein